MKNLRSGKLFSGWTVATLVADEQKEKDFDLILEDGGATVVKYTPQQFRNLSAEQFRKLDKVRRIGISLKLNFFTSFIYLLNVNVDIV